MTRKIVIDNAQYGWIGIEEGVSRRALVPGHWDSAGNWVSTDVSGEPQDVQNACAAAWTVDVVNAHKAAFPYIPPPPATLPDLAPYQFFAMLEISGKKADLDAFINALPSPQNVVARAKLDRSLIFRRDNDLVLAAQQALKMSDAELDAMWEQAASII